MNPRDASDFWSRRKAAVRAEAKAEEADKARQAARADAARLHARQAGKSDDEILQELGLPDPDGLSAGDDFTAFLGKAVPEHLRRRALRQLWGSNPVLANLDGLVDYDEDFTRGSVAAGALKTVYQVGRGAVARLDDRGTDRGADTPTDTGTDTGTAGIAASDVGQPDAASTPVLADETGATAPPAATDRADEPPALSPAPPARPRHMQFTFSDEAAT